MIEVKTELINDKKVQKFFKVAPEMVQKILANAINRTASRIRKEARKDVPSEWGVSKQEMKDFNIYRANANTGNLSAEAVLRGHRINLLRFNPTNTGTGLMFNFRGKAEEIEGGFIFNFKKRGEGVYSRIIGSNIDSKKKGIRRELTRGKYKGKQQIMYVTRDKKKSGEPILRAAVRKHTTASVPMMTESEITDIHPKIMERANEYFNAEFERELFEMMEGMGFK